MISQLRFNIKNVFSRNGFSKTTNYIRKLFSKVDRKSILFSFCMIVILAVAVFIRILPLNWGFNLSEFDPYFQYAVTRRITENGFFSWLNWHIEEMWFPQGRNVAYTSFPGFPMTGAAVYFLISILGLRVSVMDVCIVFPVIFAAITCVIAYYLGKEVGGSGVGLLSSLLLAVNPAYISRTSLGFYDDETVGIFGILITSLFYLRSIKEKKWQISLAYSIAAGASLGYVCASWGASRYLLSLLALFSFILFLTKRYNRRLLISYGMLMVIGLSIAILVPKLGYNFLREFETVAVIGVFILLAVYEAAQRFNEQQRTVFLSLVFIGLGVTAIALWHIGFISLPIAKFISVINPFERIDMPLVESVQEHRPATWSAFYYQFGALVFLGPLGIIFALRRVTLNKIFILIYAITTLYFSASMIRLTVLMAPALCILGALAISEIIGPFTRIAIGQVFTRRRLRFYPKIGKTSSVIIIITLFVISFLPMDRGIDGAYSPTTIASSSIPVKSNINDWIEALTWMRENLPEQAVVVSWWDYGYWITVMGEKISLSDNGTFNGTQIAWVGRMFMSTEEEAIAMVKDFNRYARTSYNYEKNISYVVVFTTLGLAASGPYLFGDEVKWRWMAKIGLNSTADKQLEDLTITGLLADYWSQSNSGNSALLQWYEEFRQTVALPKPDRVLTKLMIHGVFPGLVIEPEHFQLIFSSSSNFVFVYKVLY